MNLQFRIKDFIIISFVLTILALCISVVLIPNFENYSLSINFLKRIKPSPFILILFPIWVAYKLLEDLEKKQRIITIIFLVLFTGFCVHLHFTNVELGKYFDDKLNIMWQLEIHERIIRLDSAPEMIPHSYRFLADSFISLLVFWSGNFFISLIIFRIVFQFLLLLSIFYWARLYTSYRVSIITVLLYVIIYPITIRYYAGQAIDPMSHLAFILSFIFLNKRMDFYFILCILIGILAKESIGAMSVFYFFSRSPKNLPHFLKTGIFITLTLGLILFVRWYVNTGIAYESISGVTPEHILTNLKDGFRWYGQIFFTLIILTPFTYLGWKKVPFEIKSLILFLVPVLVISNLIFSWLAEARNFIPFIVPMCLITASYFLNEDFDKVKSMSTEN